MCARENFLHYDIEKKSQQKLRCGLVKTFYALNLKKKSTKSAMCTSSNFLRFKIEKKSQQKVRWQLGKTFYVLKLEKKAPCALAQTFYVWKLKKKTISMKLSKRQISICVL